MEAKLERMTAMYEEAVSQVEALQAENARLKAQLAVRPASGAGTGAGAGAAASPRRRKRLSVSRGMGLSTRGMIGRDNGSNNGSNRSLRAGSIDSSGSLTRARGWSVDGNQHGDFRMRVTFLKSVPLFHSLSEDQLERLAVKMQAQRFDDDKVIVLQGDEGNQFFVIVEGRVRMALCVCVSVSVCLTHADAQVAVHKRSPGDPVNSHGALVAELTGGDFFGERALIKSDLRAASCVAVGPVLCLVLSKDDFVQARCLPSCVAALPLIANPVSPYPRRLSTGHVECEEHAWRLLERTLRRRRVGNGWPRPPRCLLP